MNETTERKQPIMITPLTPNFLEMILEGRIAEWNKWRKKDRGVIPNLNNINLEGLDLREIDLHAASLRYANLRGTNLTNANLFGSNLEGSNFEGADLSGADLSCTYLREANFKSTTMDPDLKKYLERIDTRLTSEETIQEKLFHQETQTKLLEARMEVLEAQQNVLKLEIRLMRNS